MMADTCIIDRTYATPLVGEVSRGNPQKSAEIPKQKPQAIRRETPYQYAEIPKQKHPYQKHPKQKHLASGASYVGAHRKIA